MTDKWQPGVTHYLSIPYIGMREDGETTRNWAHFTFQPKAPDVAVSRRQIKRAVRYWVYHSLERHMHSRELDELLHRVRTASDAT